MSIGCKGSGEVCGCGEGLMCVLVGFARPNPRERANRESEVRGY